MPAAGHDIDWNSDWMLLPKEPREIGFRLHMLNLTPWWERPGERDAEEDKVTMNDVWHMLTAAGSKIEWV